MPAKLKTQVNTLYQMDLKCMFRDLWVCRDNWMRKLGSEEMKFKSFCCKTGNICSGMHRITLTDIQLGMHYIKTMRGLAVKFL